MNGKFCPKCGKQKFKFIKGFCQECFLQDNELVKIPKEIGFPYCKDCQKILLGREWFEQGEEKLIEFIEGKIKPKEIHKPKYFIELHPLENGTTIAEIKIMGEIDGVIVEKRKEILLKPKNTQCDKCMKVKSDYFESILQLRTNKKISQKKFNELVKEIEGFLMKEERKDSLAKIVFLGKVKNGLDARIGSKHAGKKLAEFFAKKFNSKIVSSYSLKGINQNGKSKKRFTFCVRF